MKDRMLSVRFQPEVIALVRRFARQDGVTVSRWLRNLVKAELKNPSRRLLTETFGPRTQTCPSGGMTRIVWIGVAPGSETATGIPNPPAGM